MCFLFISQRIRNHNKTASFKCHKQKNIAWKIAHSPEFSMQCLLCVNYMLNKGRSKSRKNTKSPAQSSRKQYRLFQPLLSTLVSFLPKRLHLDSLNRTFPPLRYHWECKLFFSFCVRKREWFVWVYVGLSSNNSPAVSNLAFSYNQNFDMRSWMFQFAMRYNIAYTPWSSCSRLKLHFW